MPRTTIFATEIASNCVRLKRDINGNPRYYVPAHFFDFAPGTQAARDLGFFKYRGSEYDSGFVIQSYDLTSDIQTALELCVQRMS